MAIVGRLVAIISGFVVAILAAGLVLTLAIVFPAWSDLVIGEYDEGVAGVMMTFGFVFVSGYALLPAIVLIAVAEIFSIRTILYYAIAGALLGLVVMISLGGFDPNLLTVNGFARRETEIVIGAGIVGALAYWLIAGRGAGRGFHVPRDGAGLSKGERA